MKTFKIFIAEEAEVTDQQLKDLEKFADRLLNKFDIDVSFTKHFKERVNDGRNKPMIKVSELQQFFKKVSKHKGKRIKQMDDNEQAVLKDIQKDLNLPIVIEINKDKEFEVRVKTIMRKPDFKTPNKVIKY